MLRPMSGERRAAFTVALALSLTLISALASAQSAAPPATVTALVAPRNPPAPSRQKPDARPTWNELSSGQQSALQPLASSWPSLSSTHKRKWIALSRNYPKLPPTEQALLHSRMSSWSALSPAERAQARLNFSESRALPADDRKARWEAYQVLTAEQKKALAQQREADRHKKAGTGGATPGQAGSQDGTSEPKGKRRPVASRALLPESSFDANTLLPQQDPGRKKPGS